MKKLFALVVCCILCAARGFAQYTIQISDGTAGLVYTAIANELDCPGGNSLNNIMPNANTVGCFLFKFDNSTATWMASYCASAGAWSPNLTLDPGEGAFLANPGPAFMLTFTGAAHTFAPFPAPYSGLYSSQETTFSPATYDDIFNNGAGAPPPANLTTMFNFNPATQSYGVKHTYASGSGNWIGGTPTAALGESVWVNPPVDSAGNKPPAPPVYIAAYLVPTIANVSLVIVWPGTGVLQQSTDLVTWTDVVPAATSPYTVPIGPGPLYFRVRP